MDRSYLTGKEITFNDDQFIVSKTNTNGIVTYCNNLCTQISGYERCEMIGKPHSILRHPEMPKCIFKLLWDTIKSGNEIFAYVVNRCKNGDHYWVFAHVTATFDEQNKIIGYHSNRRPTKPSQIQIIAPIYKILNNIEKQAKTSELGIQLATEKLLSILNNENLNYEKFVFSIY